MNSESQGAVADRIYEQKSQNGPTISQPVISHKIRKVDIIRKPGVADFPLLTLGENRTEQVHWTSSYWQLLRR